MMKKLPKIWTCAMAIALSATMSACGAGTVPAAEDEPSPPVLASHAPRDAAPRDAARPDPVPRKPRVFERVELQGSLVAAYGAATLEAFATSTFVSRVTVGRVLSSESRVHSSGEDEVVYTEVRIEPDDAPGTVILTRESGGSAPVRDLTASLSGHVSAEELARTADHVVEYVSSDFPVHSAVGDRVLVLLSGEPSGLGYFSAATLLQDGSGAFVWPAAPPNDAWARSVTAEQAGRMVRDTP